ncbi:MAG: hypothetical protein ABIK65_06270 [Candidatus Eisenbacteria bacterium]
MARHRWFLAAAVLLLASCSSKDENTLVGAEFVDARRWAVPAEDDTIVTLTTDTYFEADTLSGVKDDLLIGDRRKFRFEIVVSFANLPGREDTLISARITASPWQADGIGTVRIDRVTEKWTESSKRDTLGVVPGEEFAFDPDLDAPVPIEWVRSWVDSSAGNHGLLLRPVEGDSFFLRIPSREAKNDSGGADESAFRLHLTYRDGDSGRDTTAAIAPSFDRFYAFKVDPSSYVAENFPAATLLVGVRESMTNQALFEFDLPAELKDVTVNRFELVLTVAEARTNDAEIPFAVHRVVSDSLGSDAVVFERQAVRTFSMPPDALPGDTVAVRLSQSASGWWAAGNWDPIILIRASVNLARDRYVSFYSMEAADSLSPRLRLLYTPPRPGAGTE